MAAAAAVGGAEEIEFSAEMDVLSVNDNKQFRACLSKHGQGEAIELGA